MMSLLAAVRGMVERFVGSGSWFDLRPPQMRRISKLVAARAGVETRLQLPQSARNSAISVAFENH
jgi:hypothetical protein